MPVRLLPCLALLLCGLGAAPVGADEAAARAARIEACGIGFDGIYRLGCWTPVSVRVAGLEALADPVIEVVAPDGDGAPAFTRVAVDSAAGSINTLTRVGRRDATIRVRLLDGAVLIDEWRTGSVPQGAPRALPAERPLVVEVGAALPVESLPTDWLAYEGVEALVLPAQSEPQHASLSAPQVDAIRRWVQSGGHLVLCGGEHADALVGRDAPMASLAPGVFVEVARLPGAGVVEDYAGSDISIDTGFGGLPVGRLDGVAGTVELHAGGREDEMPLVVRSLQGFGRVTYVAFNPYAPELLAWPDRPRLMARVLGIDADPDAARRESSALITAAYEDLPGAMHSKLGAAFHGVGSVTIFTVVGAAAIYLLLMGPGAYYLGRRVTRRMTTAWIACPLIALAVGGGSAWFGNRITGDTVQLNRLEVIDIDAQTGLQRGTLWAQLYSPRPALYDVTCRPVKATNSGGAAEQGYLSWFGLPGAGLGGMQTAAGSLLATDVRYSVAPSLEGVRGAPINRRASKALTARWLVPNQPTVRFELTPTDSGLVEGRVTNDTPHTLSAARLIAQGWAWRLPDLMPGDTAVISDRDSPARLRTLLLNDLGSVEQRSGEQGAGARSLSVDRLGADGIVQLMMFYEEIGAAAVSPLPAGPQPRIDLSHALAGGRPILLARGERPAAELMSDAGVIAPQAAVEGVYYRFIGPPLTPVAQPR